MLFSFHVAESGAFLNSSLAVDVVSYARVESEVGSLVPIMKAAVVSQLSQLSALLSESGGTV